MEKKCSTCRDILSLSHFSRDRARLDGYRSQCKKCSYASKQVTDLKKKYGITPAQYEELFESQEGNCAVCGRHQLEFKRRFDVDHNHDTGEVRGLLCHDCNRALGFLKDDPALAESAMNYLKARGNYAKNI